PLHGVLNLSQRHRTNGGTVLLKVAASGVAEVRLKRHLEKHDCGTDISFTSVILRRSPCELQECLRLREKGLRKAPVLPHRPHDDHAHPPRSAARLFDQLPVCLSW